MNLNDNEIRDITKHLEAGKPLPDKYRFLLFEEKREVELVWNGTVYDYVFLDQEGFKKYKPKCFKDLVKGLRDYKLHCQRHGISSHS
jgi:hypothetical protein